MAKLEDILTELVLYATERKSFVPRIDGLVSTAIANAAKQIKAQQRERVKRLKNAVKSVLDPEAEFPPNREAFPLWLELETALKELEAE